MSPSDLEIFLREILCDQRLTALSVKAGEHPSFKTIIRLGGETESIYILATLEGRNFDLIEQHRALWEGVCEFFDEAVLIWQSVPTNGELLQAHLDLLTSLQKIARDRLEFYSVAEVDHHRRS